jgi:5,6-dimethylbenzimidazole synthase
MIPNHDPLYDYETLYRVMTDRMSVRRLKPDPIPDDYVTKVVDAGRWAMSGANSQPWEFMIVKDEGVKKGLFEAYRDVNTDFIFWMEQMRQFELRHPVYQVEGDPREQWEKARNSMSRAWSAAPVLIVILGDGRRQWGTVQGAMTFGRHASHLTDALSNAATLMHLAASALGLGSQHVTIHVEEPFKRVLGIPDLVMIHHIIPLGYPAVEKRQGPGVRRSFDEVVHYDRYDMSKYMTNADIIDFLRGLRGLTMNSYHDKAEKP